MIDELVLMIDYTLTTPLIAVPSNDAIVHMMEPRNSEF